MAKKILSYKYKSETSWLNINNLFWFDPDVITLTDAGNAIDSIVKSILNRLGENNKYKKDPNYAFWDHWLHVYDKLEKIGIEPVDPNGEIDRTIIEDYHSVFYN